MVNLLPKTEPTTNTCLICSKRHTSTLALRVYRITAEELAGCKESSYRQVRAACLERF